MRKALMTGVVGLVVAAGLCGAAALQPAGNPGQQTERRVGQPPAGNGSDMGAMLISGLEQSPGCLGVDAGRFQSGKMAIVAWFENKEAVLAWYNSPIHRRMAGSMTGGAQPGEALAHVTDEETPIMVIASMTPATDPAATSPFSQLAIELYAPLPGGAYVNSRLAPDSFEVPHMRGLKQEAAAEGEARD